MTVLVAGTSWTATAAEDSEDDGSDQQTESHEAPEECGIAEFQLMLKRKNYKNPLDVWKVSVLYVRMSPESTSEGLRTVVHAQHTFSNPVLTWSAMKRINLTVKVSMTRHMEQEIPLSYSHRFPQGDVNL